MDNTTNNKGDSHERSEEEVSWDAEFADMEEPKEKGYPTMLADLAKLVVQVPSALVQLPKAILPEDTARHAKAALREGFLALRSLLGAIGDGIEGMLTDEATGKPAATVSGPQGTWGTARYSSTPSAPPPGKARRIELSDEVSERSGSDGATRITIDDLGSDTEEEGRGLRADIDY